MSNSSFKLYIHSLDIRQASQSWHMTWKAMEDLLRLGLVKSIGVSNFGLEDLHELLSISSIPPAVVQNFMDPFHQDAEVRRFCKERGIAYMAFSLFGTQRSNNEVMENSVISRIAAKHSKSVANVILSWALQNDVVVIPRSRNAQRIKENMSLLRSENHHEFCSGMIETFLDAQDMRDIISLDQL